MERIKTIEDIVARKYYKNTKEGVDIFDKVFDDLKIILKENKIKDKDIHKIILKLKLKFADLADLFNKTSCLNFMQLIRELSK